ncbi:hypothetical protein K437DRAFT_293054 [Tilletiaria anomala UBC 951]|uniref:B-related factor 1 n=1 Tax=Tilletiaria anomala (strain ATCC 24038 / CBS 436.72 / UBC 951) TaxID=1037660 RepID=A0A066WN85_TILAU|nr:uncharacterized protein K437DRAFT_293054 [Tilletiaria anomala UBC 951]KDN52444.1 hypothetical protein K437DRAFT_293054 [Tilletiaria anomala UBC 951]
MRTCPQCDSDSIETQDGTQVCTQCGHVLGESEIVNDVTFGETSAGAATVHGTQVSGSTGKHAMVGPGGRRYGDGTDSREATIYNAKQAIRNLCRQLNQESEDLHQTATRLFTLALNIGQGKQWFPNPETLERDAAGNLVQGRRSQYSYGACVYLAFRRKKIPIMLIEIADLIKVNVFVLGRAYLRLAQLLRFDPEQRSIDIMEPSIYIRRFARLLDFGDEYERVVEDASRLCIRFKNDWLVQGRRPSGITGACLLLAARMNNFRRSVAEVVQVVKVADVTLKKRLDEFRATPAAKMSIHDFRQLYNNVSDGAMPPSATSNQAQKARKGKEKKEEIARKISANAKREDVRGKNKADSSGVEMRSSKKWSSRTVGDGQRGEDDDGSESDDQADDLVDSDEGEASGAKEGALSAEANTDVEEQVDQVIADEVQGLLQSDRLRDDFDRVVHELEQSERRAKLTAAERQAQIGTSQAAARGAASGNEGSGVVEEVDALTTRPKKRARSGEEQASDSVAMKKSKLPAEDPKDPLANLDEEELDEYLLSKDEELVKERIWTEFNKEWLEESLQKAIKEEEDLKRGIQPKRSKPRKKPVLRDSSNAAGSSALESTVNMMKQKKFSRKINYSALGNLLPNQSGIVSAGGSRPHSELDDLGGIGAAYNMIGRAASQARSEASTGLGGESDFGSEDDKDIDRDRSRGSRANGKGRVPERAGRDSRSRDGGSDAGGFVSDGGAYSDAYAEEAYGYDDAYE